MMNGSLTLDGFVPDVDATIVTRILDAGGNIVGKAVCENLCVSGGSFTAVTGPVLNPHNKTRMAGGSSSGSAALVGKGGVESGLSLAISERVRLLQLVFKSRGQFSTDVVTSFLVIKRQNPRLIYVIRYGVDVFAQLASLLYTFSSVRWLGDTLTWQLVVTKEAPSGFQLLRVALWDLSQRTD